MSRAVPMLLVLLATGLPATRAEGEDPVDVLYEEARATHDHYAQAAVGEQARARDDGSTWGDAATDGCYAAQTGETARRERGAHEDANGTQAGVDARAVALARVAGNLSRGGEAPPEDVLDALDVPRPPNASELRDAFDAAVLDGVATVVVLSDLPGATGCLMRAGLSNRTRTLAHEDAPNATRLVDERTGAPITSMYASALETVEETAGAAGVDPYALLEPPDVVGHLDPIVEAVADAECELLDVCPPEDAP